MQVSIDMLNRIVRTRMDTKAALNAQSVVGALNVYGAQFGVTQPHRLAQYLAQILHESGQFIYDREIWGPTEAQKKYDTRADLGNTPAVDGDGYKYRGRTALQITGRNNVQQFYDWCTARIATPEPPNFVDDPDLLNTDPWEGLGPLWYWDTRNLNRYADSGDIEMLTKRINGGLNGLEDRIACYVRAALVMLDRDPTDIGMFQHDAGIAADGIAGPRTRAELHKALVALTATPALAAAVQAAPVTAAVAAVPAAIDKPVTHTTGFWERIIQLGGLSSIGGAAAFLQDWRTILAIAGILGVVTVGGLVLHKRIIDAVKTIKQELG